ncbi:MAG: hypothetical protein M1821_006870 [Bathelium mastoideum]|nr:MAG: hypothetical protein M1821_006870 [Bathelium mastoideum]KAI9676314.1 MAG: hypothetical protein M1822_008348 [Bathelium mastoideum]
MDAHNTAVASIAEQVASFYKRKKQFRIYHGSTNSTRSIHWSRDQIVDTSGLKNVLQVDEKTMTAVVEPNVAMDALVEETLKHGLVPQVVMEFPGITAGGGFSGASGESSSFKYGLFEDTITRIEIVLANGEIAVASANECADLFYGAANAFGSLGVVTLLDVKLIWAKPYVEVSYHPVFSIKEAVEKTKAAASDPRNDYVDGILYKKDFGVIMTGRLSDSANGSVVQFTRPQDPWFYIHVERLFRKARVPPSEATPIRDYLFRYDRGVFWALKYAFRYFLTPFNRITRWLLDPFMRARVAFRAFHAAGLGKENLLQDCALPASTVQPFIEYIDAETGLYPLWLCPLTLHTRPEKSLNPSHCGELVINVGIWGPGPRDQDRFVLLNRSIEQKVLELRGLKCLYARAYYTEEEFWNIYDRKWYDALREKYEARSLPSLYDKVKVDLHPEQSTAQLDWKAWVCLQLWETWPVAGLFGVAKAFVGGDYLLAK